MGYASISPVNASTSQPTRASGWDTGGKVALQPFSMASCTPAYWDLSTKCCSKTKLRAIEILNARNATMAPRRRLRQIGKTNEQLIARTVKMDGKDIASAGGVAIAKNQSQRICEGSRCHSTANATRASDTSRSLPYGFVSALQRIGKYATANTPTAKTSAGPARILRATRVYRAMLATPDRM